MLALLATTDNNDSKPLYIAFNVMFIFSYGVKINY